MAISTIIYFVVARICPYGVASSRSISCNFGIIAWLVCVAVARVRYTAAVKGELPRRWAVDQLACNRIVS